MDAADDTAGDGWAMSRAAAVVPATAVRGAELGCEVAPRVLAALLRRNGDRAECEDAVGDALLAAATQWPADGIPDDPGGWLIRVASRKLLDAQRRDAARRRREQQVFDEPTENAVTPVSAPTGPEGDDTLDLLLRCAHPALRDVSQVALTLRAVLGLSTAQIAAAFLVGEATMAQRISRAKSTIRAAGGRFAAPAPAERTDRLPAVRHVLYLMFTAGHTAASGDRLIDGTLAAEAIRLAELLHTDAPGDVDTAGLLALLLLTQARSAARTDPDGELVPLDEQDRTRWDRRLITRGIRLVERALPSGRVGPYQLQAAIAAVHAEAGTAADTDWLQITVLYRMLAAVAPSPTVQLNLAVAVGMAHGPAAGLAALAPLLTRPDQGNHRVPAAQAHLLERAGRFDAARDAFDRAARMTQSIPEQRYLNRRAARLPVTGTVDPGPGRQSSSLLSSSLSSSFASSSSSEPSASSSSSSALSRPMASSTDWTST